MGINMTITSFCNFSKDKECDKNFKKFIFIYSFFINNLKNNIQSTSLRGNDAFGDVFKTLEF